MIIAYIDTGHKTLLAHEIHDNNQALLKKAIWIDLIYLTKTEEGLVENAVNLDIPTREEMREIELSSRLYKENNALFMTATMLAHSDSPEPQYDAVTFVVTQHQLITIRYIEPQSFKLFISQLPKLPPQFHSAISLFIELLDVTVDRLADILEVIGHRLDEYSKTIFHTQEMHELRKKLDYHQLMQQLGANGDLNTKARESLMMFNRLVTFFGQTYGTKLNSEKQLRLATLSKDIQALSDHVTFFSTKVNFLLDATLGMISIEQNTIIKIFSVAAVIFLPPTLIASIYGMNFMHMPELSWKWGYLGAISLMLISALLPFLYFKRRKWL